MNIFGKIRVPLFLARVLVVFLPILQAAALFAYAYFIFQQPIKTIGKEYKVPLG